MSLFDIFKNKKQPKVEKVIVEKSTNQQKGTPSTLSDATPKTIIFCLRHVVFETITNSASNKSGKHHQSTTFNLPKAYHSQNFVAPQGMDLPDVCKVASYLKQKTDMEKNLEPTGLESAVALTHSLEQFGFVAEVRYNYANPETTSQKTTKKPAKVYKLYTVVGDFNKFRATEMYKEYFEWYTPNVSEEEIKIIYQKIGQTLPPIQNEHENI